MATSQQGGGQGASKAPTVESFEQAVVAATGEATVDTEVLTGVVSDQNGEETIVSLTMGLTGDVTGSFVHNVVQADLDATTEPGTFTNGWKVWNEPGGGAKGDGKLQFKFQFPYVERGVHTWELTVSDGALTGTSAPISVTIYKFEVFSDPVDGAGDTIAAGLWGDWSADPGTTAVGGNFVKVINGKDANQGINIDFDDDTFIGGTDDTWEILLPGSITYIYWTGAAGSAPPVLADFTNPGAPSADGKVTLTIPGAGEVLYVYYELALPDPLLDQGYSAGFTVVKAP